MDGRTLSALSGQEGILVIRRPLVGWLGHVSDALLLDQGLYWQAAAGAGNWWAETDERAAAHLCLTLHALAQARGRLIERGLLETARLGVPARMHYRLDADAVAAAFEAHLTGGMSTTSSADSQNKPGESAEHSINEGTVKVLKDNAPNGAADAAAGKAPKAKRERKPKPEADREMAALSRALFGDLCAAQGWSSADLTTGNRQQLAMLAKRILEEPERFWPSAAQLMDIADRARRALAERLRKPVGDLTVLQFRQAIGAWIRARQEAEFRRNHEEAATAAAEALRAQEAAQASSPAAVAWKGIADRARRRMAPATFDTWFRGTRGASFSAPGALTVAVPSVQAAEWLGGRFGADLAELAREVGLTGLVLQADGGLEPVVVASPGFHAATKL